MRQPNQWCKVINAKENGFSGNIGKCLAVESGPPTTRVVWDGTKIKSALAFTIKHMGNTSPDPAYKPIMGLTGIDLVEAHRVELLGPDECRRLDAQYGLDGAE